MYVILWAYLMREINYSSFSSTGVPPQTGTATLVVTVVDVNDNKPELPEEYNNVVVRQTTQKDALVASFRASDRDSAKNGPPFDFTWNCNAPECTDFRLTVIKGTQCCMLFVSLGQTDCSLCILIITYCNLNFI